MPNWCSNTVRVTAETPEKLKEFYDSVIFPDPENPKWPKITLNHLLPTPPELLDESAFGKSENREALIEKYGASDWYQWRIENWGTKWDITESFIEVDDPTELLFVFDSAWAPPVAWLEKIASKFPELRFGISYEEPGIDFCGYYIFENGEVVENDETGYQFFEEDTDKPIEFNSDLQKWVYLGTTDIVSENEDYWPEGRNPFYDRIHM